MGRYAVSRIIGMIPTVFLLLAAVVGLVRVIPGDVVDLMMEETRADDATRQEIRAKLSLDDSYPIATAKYAVGFVQGDLGKSLWNDRSVISMMHKPAIVSLELATLAFIFASSLGLFIGVMSAVKQDSFADFGLRAISITSLSVPNFAVATAVIVLPAIYFGWTPPIFFTPFTSDPLLHFGGLILPAFITGLDQSASIMRLTRTMMLEVLRQDFIRTAYAKGLTMRTVLVRHSLRNAMIPVVTVMGLQVANLVSGAIVIETVFGLPGLGRLLITALSQRDYPVIQGITVMVGIGIMTVNLLVDISYGLLDPRVKVGS